MTMGGEYPPLVDPMADTLDVRAQLDGARLLVMGGTGFLGKVWLSMLLHHFLRWRIYLVVRQRKQGGVVTQTSEQRFWSEIAPSEVFEPIRERYPGGAYDAMMAEKITVIPGDVTEPFGGIPDDVRAEFRRSGHRERLRGGRLQPSLDYALNVNAFGTQNLVDMARDLAGKGLACPSCTPRPRTWRVAERARWMRSTLGPSRFRERMVERSHWDPEHEIAECVDLVENVRHRSNDTSRSFSRGGQAQPAEAWRAHARIGIDDELSKTKRRFEEKQLVDWGTERAQYWGWHNIYTYTKSIGEQILARSGVPLYRAARGHRVCAELPEDGLERGHQHLGAAHLPLGEGPHRLSPEEDVSRHHPGRPSGRGHDLGACGAHRGHAQGGLPLRHL